MLFSSIDFAVFFPLVFLLYWITAANLRVQNLLIVVASYVFYGWWDYRFLGLILFSSSVDYLLGLNLARSDNHRNRKLLLWSSLAINLGLLGFFKYYNFFLENFVTAFTFFGSPIKGTLLNIILPVGISFYTFQTLSYTIDIYRRKLEPTSNYVAFLAFVSFFPQLVAGPIERAKNLLPQFLKKRPFHYDQAVNGSLQMLWGFFKKLVIADNCAIYVDMIFGNSDAYSGSTLLLGAVLFAFQIYCDFSGYSDIAIGAAKLLGINLMQNFAFPYFSRDIAEFWRRWHISLSTWFRDYLYIPLGGSRGSTGFKIRNIFIIFLVSGFWHGANWTFLVWGALNALYFLPLMLMDRNRLHLDIVAKDRKLPSAGEVFQVFTTFLLTTIAWIFFRAAHVTQGWEMVGKVFSPSILHPIQMPTRIVFVAILLVLFLIIEWTGRRETFPIATIGQSWPRGFRWSFYSSILFLIGWFTQTGRTPFIYFQF